MACLPLALMPRPVRARFHRGAVHADAFHPDLNDSFLLQPFKHALQDAVFALSVQAGLHCTPFSVFFRQRSPFAAVFQHIQHRIDQLEILDFYISSLLGQVFFYFPVCFLSNFHALILSFFRLFVNCVNIL